MSVRTARLALAACAFGITAAASAAPVVGGSLGSFSNLGGCASTGASRDCRVVNTSNGPSSELQWGSTSSSRNFASPSTLTARATGWAFGTPANDVVLARLDWFNSATRADRTPDELSARWNLAMAFALPRGSRDPGAFEAFDLSIVNAPNPGGDLLSGFTLVDLAGIELSLAGVRISDMKYSVTGGVSSLSADRVWFNPEGNLSSLLITADFSTVPEPGVFALLGLGAVGVVAARRKQRPAGR